MKERREGTYCPKCKSSILFGELNDKNEIIVTCTNCPHTFKANRPMDYALAKVNAGQML